MGPYLVSSAVVLGIVALCFARPNAGRIFLGFFYLVMAFGVNGAFILTSPESYAGYASMSYWPLYRDVVTWTIGALGPVVLGILLITYEVTLTALLLSSGPMVKIGLAGVIVFILAITPMSTLQIPWLGLAVAAAYLLRQNYPRTLFQQLSRPKAVKPA